MASGKWVSYLRVSTQEQGRSGLGLEAQRETIERYLNGGGWRMVDEFVEVESGKQNDRPELKKALDACKRKGAKLIIAKLCRLSRNVAFISALMESGVEFLAVDNPTANKLTVHILAAFAENERAEISARTKAALAAAERRGVRLGNPKNLTDAAAAKGRKLGRQAHREKADEFARRNYPRIAELQGQGSSLRSIAKVLNEEGILTARGTEGNWTHQAVKAVIERVKTSK